MGMLGTFLARRDVFGRFMLLLLLLLLLCLTRIYVTLSTPRCTREGGGTYNYLDEGVSEGTWVYRVSDMSK